MSVDVACLRVLNVGGGTSREPQKPYQDWQQDVLDIDPAVKPDIICDARRVAALPASQYDAVFCSHMLEHCYQHDVPQVLAGFLHVLKPTGFAHIIVPDIGALFAAIVNRHQDIHDIWYVSPSGPITFHDVLYGWSKQVEVGNLYYCHKTGFTARALSAAMTKAGFAQVILATDGWNLYGFGFKSKATEEQRSLLGLQDAHLA